MEDSKGAVRSFLAGGTIPLPALWQVGRTSSHIAGRQALWSIHPHLALA